MKELCEARAKLETSSNFQIYPQGGKSDPPFETARGQSELFAFQCERALWSKSKTWNELKFSDLPLGGVNLMDPPLPPFKTAKEQSELFAFQCDQWEPIQNSQLIGKYKEK